MIAQAIDELSAVNPTRTVNHLRGGEGVWVADGMRLVELGGNLAASAMAFRAVFPLAPPAE